MMRIPDDTLLLSFKEGNDLAFVQLYERYKRPVYGFILGMVHDPDLAKDVVQTVFLRLYESPGSIGHADRFRSWIFTVARNECISSMRRSSRRSPLDDSAEIGIPDVAGERLERDEEAAIIRAAIANLTIELREVLLLREYEELSYREIAAVLAVEEHVVKSRLFMARRKLVERLRPIFQERSA